MFDHHVSREWGITKGWDVMKMTPNQPTFPQICNFLEYLKKQNISVEKFQNFIESGDLVAQMLRCPDLSKIDRVAFKELFAPKLSIPWTPVLEYVDRIMARSKLRGWGFTRSDAKRLAASLHDHEGDLRPTGLKVWLGKDIKFNLHEMILWLRDEVRLLGFGFTDYISGEYLSFHSGSEISGDRSLEPEYFDLQTFSGPQSTSDVRLLRTRWPSIEVVVLLALNPQVYVLMSDGSVPRMIAAGLVVCNSYHAPIFLFNNISGACINAEMDCDEWLSYTVAVAFRE